MKFDGKSLVLALGTGVAVFLLVGGTVTAVAETWIEFSLLIGLPAGVVAGGLATVAVYLGLMDDVPETRRDITGIVAWASAGCLVGFVVLAGLANLGVTVALAVSVIIGLVVAGAVFIRTANQPDEHLDEEHL